MSKESKVVVGEGKNAMIMDIQDDLTAAVDKDLDAAYKEICENNPDNIILKFHEKQHINSTGLAMVINMLIDSREKGRKVYALGLIKHYRKIFEISGLNNYITMIDSEDEIGC